MVNLYIENRLIELDKEVQFAITKTFEDITNPTSIINDWSKTVSIPFTHNNNEIFGHIYNPDRLTLHNGLSTTGLYFDPLKKLNFRLEWDSSLLMSGYAKMTSITKSNGKGRYNITLNGELGKIFQEMKKITFDSTMYSGEDKDKYWINGSSIEKKIINKTTIQNLWKKEPTYSTVFSNMKDFVNFAPNLSFSKGFNHKGFEDNGQYKSFVDLFNENNFVEENNVDPDSLLPNGLNAREFGEFRSYLQLPFINIYKLFAIFKNKFESISDYTINYDSEWFNDTNPYWSNLVYMLKPLSTDNDESVTKIFNSTADRSLPWYNSYNNTTKQTLTPKYTNVDSNIFDTSSKRFKIKENMLVLSSSFNFTLLGSKKSTGKTYLGTKNGLVIIPTVTFYNGTSVVRALDKKFIVVDEDCSLTLDDSYTVIKLSAGDTTDTYAKWQFEIPVTYSLMVSNTLESSCDIKFICYWLNNEEKTINSVSDPYTFIEGNESSINIKVNNNLKRSFGTYTINDVWDNQYNLFTEILKYLKKFHLLVSVDDINKSVSFTPFKSFFKNYLIEDWTDKLDTSKEYFITPISFEDKYILFNYKDNDLKLNKLHKEKYGINYGEYKLITEYNFNNNTKELFDESNTSIVSTDYLLSFNDLSNNKLVYLMTDDVFVENKDKDYGQVTNLFGQYYFFDKTKPFDSSLNLPAPIVSDDSADQQYSEDYYYTKEGVPVTSYPYLSTITENNCVLYTKPTQIYTNEKVSSVLNGIYDNFWKNYLDERYNINNKLVTCYLKITPKDYMSFTFNKFVKIENQLYFVNKIYDYDITSNTPTKVDLVTVQNINGYLEDNFYYELFKFTDKYNYNVSNIELSYNVEQTYYLSTTTDVHWRCNDPGILINGNSNSGNISAGVKIPITIKSTNNTTGNYSVIFTNTNDEEINIIIKTTAIEVGKMRLVKSNGQEWTKDDRISFMSENGGQAEPQTYILYLYSTEPVTFKDVDGNLRRVLINNMNGSGTLPAGNPTVVDIWCDDASYDYYGTYRLTCGDQTIDIDIDVSNRIIG